MKENFQVIGKSHPRVEGMSKATGTAQYTADISFPNMLFCKLLRSPHAHARIISIDSRAVQAHPGVVDIMTGTELTKSFGVLPVSKDEHALAYDKVRYVGDPLAAVVAVDEATAEAALALFKVEYEILPSFMSVEEALQPTEDPIHTYTRRGNISKEVNLEFGDVESGFAQADHIREDLFYYGANTHMAMEEHATIATTDDQGYLTVYSSTQTPHYLHKAMADVLGKPAAHIRIIAPTLGGGFGGKSEPFSHELVVAYLACKTGRTIKYVATREEVFYIHRGRHAVLMRLKTGVRKDGTITAMQYTNFVDGGGHASFGVATLFYTGIMATTTYKIPHYKFDGVRMFTNKPPAGPKRGHGTPQPRFALELQLDKIAEELGMSPIDLRMVNIVSPNSITANHLRITSCAIAECIRRVDSASGFSEKRSSLPPGKGIGFAMSSYLCGAGLPLYHNPLDHSQVMVRIDRSGGVTVYTGSTDIGQGSRSIHALLVAEILGLQQEDIFTISADTALTPVDLGSYSSRVTFMSGNAAIKAARELRGFIAEAVAKKLETPLKDIIFHNGQVMDRNNPGKTVTFPEACTLAEDHAGPLVTVGGYKPPELAGPFKGSGVGISPAYSYSAAVIQVDCDAETGLVTVEKVWIAHDIGRVLSLENALGQIHGSVYMGLGEALMEEQVTRGILLKAPSVLDYKTPTSLDMPPVESIFVEEPDAAGPFGAKEMGQGPILSVMPALVNAIHNALGVRIDELPATPEKILKALEDKAKGGSGRYGKTTEPSFQFSKPRKVARPWDSPYGEQEPYVKWQPEQSEVA